MEAAPCYFGPDSVTRRILSDPSAWFGGGRSLLLQSLHPAAMSVFTQNSNFRDDPWGRLVRTARYVEAVVFGDREEADTVSARVRRIHARTKAHDPETGGTLRADDPDLLLWVHATCAHSFLVAYERYAYRLSKDDADRYVAEMVRFAELAGLVRSSVPATRGDLSDYLRGVRGLQATPAAMDAMRMILFAPPIPLALRPFWAAASTAIIALLPREARALYGLPWHPAANPAVRSTVFCASRIYNVLAAKTIRNRFSVLGADPAGRGAGRSALPGPAVAAAS